MARGPGALDACTPRSGKSVQGGAAGAWCLRVEEGSIAAGKAGGRAEEKRLLCRKGSSGEAPLPGRAVQLQLREAKIQGAAEAMAC